MPRTGIEWCWVAAAVFVVSGCDDPGAAPDPRSEGRVNAVQADESDRIDPPEEFCDVYRSPQAAEAFVWPALVSEPPDGVAGWRWVNVWATWCEPCVDELPHLSEWSEELADEGLVDLELVAVDESRRAVATFRDRHAGIPESRLIAETEEAKEWFEAIGLDRRAPLPVQILVDEAGRARCMRAGPVTEDHLPTMANILEQ